MYFIFLVIEKLFSGHLISTRHYCRCWDISEKKQTRFLSLYNLASCWGMGKVGVNKRQTVNNKEK